MTEKLKLRVRDTITLLALVLLMALPGLSKLPVIDRDEARYAQASVQMIESGDYINIKFQDRARNKKPAGAYWAQTLSVNLFSDTGARAIWAHRLPSVFAALIAVMAVYWGGIRMLGREVALMGAVLLSISMLFVFEAHIAKTDALLCAMSALVLASLGVLRNGGGRTASILFWIALGAGVMIKGPLLPILVILCVVSLVIWERDLSWLKPLGFWLGPVVFALIVLPWTVLIFKETGGDFFKDAIGGDLTPKLKGGQERHGGPPGYYLMGIWVFFWPASLFLLAGFSFALRAAFNKAVKTGPVARSARLLLCWTVPFWIMLEIVPTKLPHYPLPVYPALALMAGASALTLTQVREFKYLRHISAFLFLVVSIALPAGILFAQARYGDYPSWSFAVMGLVIVLAFFAAIQMWKGHGRPAIWLSLLAALLINIASYQFILPSLSDFRVAERIGKALKSEGYRIPLNPAVNLISTQYTEPSLVYHLGTHILLGQPQKRLQQANLKSGDIVVIDKKKEPTAHFNDQIKHKLANKGLCLEPLFSLNGFNYAKGDEVEIEALKVSGCVDPVTSP
ncbi:MAG TPA: glycosyltransferase family 39 protein [Hellea balneolensis]|uniref:Glycosyltransferase family 39 protein n=1 Tax=Hellea balneolensis TaxID=287478 RepID=A0A7C5M2I1_9PROT|nr:glycosyltransferase family 39 protein [Hellea balneolensis]